MHSLNHVLGLVLFIVIFSFGCKQDKTSKKEITKIQFSDLGSTKELLLSSLVEGEIEYIQLESKAECLLKNRLRIYADNDLLIAFADEDQIMLFDRKTGNYIRRIGNRDRSPLGFKQTVFSYPYDYEKKEIFVKGWKENSFRGFDLEGNLKRKIELETDSFEWITSFVPLDKRLKLGYVWNFNGQQKNKFIFYNEKDEKLNTIPQKTRFKWSYETHGLSMFRWNCWFYKFENKLNYIEFLKDTLFSFNGSNVVPRYKFQGKAGIGKVFESKRYLLFDYHKKQGKGFGVYNKQSLAVEVCEAEAGINDDINSFLSFKPQSITPKGEVVAFVSAFDVKRWFQENPDKAKHLPEHLQKLYKMSETDNPLVMIVKLKE
jgi:hypothetical protein